jgi:tetratricopeptide (TPR) repeat protein
VCLKALALDPAARYPNARALAEDLERWLADEPVSARRDPPWTRSWRWVRKHRTLATAAAAVVLVSLAGSIVAYRREAAAAERTFQRLREATQANEDYLTDVGQDVLLGQTEFAALRSRLLERSLKYYEQLTRELAGARDPRERALLARGRDNLGRILGILGRHAEAREQGEAAVAIWQALASARPDVLDYQHALSASYNSLGLALQVAGEPARAAEAYRKAIGLLTALAAARPDVPGYRAELAKTYGNLAPAFRALGRVDEAVEATRESLRPRTGDPDQLYNGACGFALCVPIA